MKISDLVKLSDKLLLPTYNRNKIEFVKGKNALLKDSKGKEYIDFLSGLGVVNLGYNHKQLTKSLKKIIHSPWHVTNLFQIQFQAKLAQKLLPQGFKGKTFFGNSGAEANEAAYKLAIKYGRSIHPKKNQILSAFNSFHGRSFAALNLTGQEKFKTPFSPLLDNVNHFELNNESDFSAKINRYTAAVIIECVQGEGGVYLLEPEFMEVMSKLCRKHQALLIVDEVQSGNYRTGTQYAFEQYLPGRDIIIDGFTTAKALANGLPIGAFTVKKNLASILQPGDHGSTFGGNPFVTQVAYNCLTILETLKDKQILDLSITQFQAKLQTLSQKYSFIKEVRQMGLMIGIEVEAGSISTNDVAAICLEEGLIINSIKDKIIRLLPPLTIKNKWIKKGMHILDRVIGQMAKRKKSKQIRPTSNLKT